MSVRTKKKLRRARATSDVGPSLPLEMPALSASSLLAAATSAVAALSSRCRRSSRALPLARSSCSARGDYSAGAKLVVLGGPAMLIGLGGGAAG